MLKFKVCDKGSNGKFCGLSYLNKSKRYSAKIYDDGENPKAWIVEIHDKENNSVDSEVIKSSGDNPTIVLKDYGIFRKGWKLRLKDAEFWYPNIF